MQDELIYLDNNATTRPDPRVVEAMLPFLRDQYGNPSSLHRFGGAAAAAIEAARGRIAQAVGARESEIIFTSGGTEADNLALRGVLVARPSQRRLVISAIEHHAILEPAEALEREGVTVTRVGLDAGGAFDLAALAEAITPDTALVSVMLANNETGAVLPIHEIARIAHERGVRVHTDAVNALGKIPVRCDALDVDYMSLSGHKVHAPKGCGALVVRRGAPLRPLLVGGPQERQRRGGTQNVAGIVALGEACALFAESSAGEFVSDAAKMAGLRDRFERDVRARCRRAHVIAANGPRLPNTSCICFEGVEAEALLILLSEAGVCVSSGAACSSGSLEASHVLKAMAIDPRIAQGQVRFSLSRLTTADELDRALAALEAALARLAKLRVD